MLVILSMALLPLGLIALFASMESAQTNRLYRESEARLMASDSARKINSEIAGVAFALRSALAGNPTEAACRHAAAALPSPQRRAVPVAIYAADGRRICTDPRFSRWPGQPPRGQIGAETQLLEPAGILRVTVSGPGGLFAIGELPGRAIADLARPHDTPGSYSLALKQGSAQLRLSDVPTEGPLDRRVIALVPVAGGQMALEMVVRTNPITALEMLMVLLPLLMWAAAAVIGWLVVERLLLSPLAQMQRSIAGYRAGDGPLVLPKMTTPAHEIRNLGEAFRKVTNDLASHEAELEQGLARQTRLTREVHHRVKNNLQVVSSLINLHARGVADSAVAAAYASIQRRVDALAIVHRNHYAELEENRGVSLRSLVGELAGNLRAMAPPEAARMTITLNMTPAFATQDVAVPIAFLITEIVELVTSCAPATSVAITLQPGATADRAILTIEAPGLDAEACVAHPTMDRFRRIVQGLARQLRSTLDHEEGSGRYEIEIAIVPDGF
jgi:two-component sensor histidine kinase